MKLDHLPSSPPSNSSHLPTPYQIHGLFLIIIIVPYMYVCFTLSAYIYIYTYIHFTMSIWDVIVHILFRLLTFNLSGSASTAGRHHVTADFLVLRLLKSDCASSSVFLRLSYGDCVVDAKVFTFNRFTLLWYHAGLLRKPVPHSNWDAPQWVTKTPHSSY